MSTTALLWHYTIGQNYQLIRTDGALKPSAAYTVFKNWPVVWFSRNQVWDSAVTKGMEDADGAWQPLTQKELGQLAGGLFRIGVAPATAPHDWDAFVRQSGITPDVALNLRRTAKARGANHKDWFVSFDPVEQSKWLAVQAWENDHWIDVAQLPANQLGRSFYAGWGV